MMYTSGLSYTAAGLSQEIRIYRFINAGGASSTGSLVATAELSYGERTKQCTV